MTGEMGSPLIAVTTNHRVRPPVVVGMLAALFAACVATGILLPRVGSGPGQASGAVSSVNINAWLLAVPAVPAAPALPKTMIDAWLLAVPAAPAPPSTMIDAWRLALR